MVKCDNNCEDCVINADNLPKDPIERIKVYNEHGLCVMRENIDYLTPMDMRGLRNE